VGQFSTEANNLVGIACRADGDYSQAGCCLGGASLVFNFNCCIAPQEALTCSAFSSHSFL
jgi:hypothetical protein